MSIKDEIERIGNNVSDALAATAEMGATVPDGANSDDLGDLIRSIPTGGGGAGAPMWIYAYGQSYNSLKVTTKDGYESDFEVDNLFEISRQRPIFLKTQVINVVAGKNVTGYFGYKGDALFHGFYYDFDGNRVPATAEMSVNASNGIKQVAITDEKWAGSSVDLNITPGDSGGGTSINVTAEVGQTIVVKEVDANGKPTAWEAVDYQPRTHWSETTEIMPETTIEIDPENGEGMALVDFALEPNKAYTIKYNGVEYAGCVGMELEYLMFGNLGVLDESLPVTEHPFILASMVGDMDEDGNTDYVIAVIPLDGAESVTVSISEETVHKIPEEYTPTPYYVYEINKDAFERGGSANRTFYLAYVTEMPVSLLEAMYLRKPVYLRVIDGTGAYMVPAQYCGQIDTAWLVADKTQDTVSFQGVMATTAIRISVHISDAYQSFSEYYIRFQGEM